MASRTSAALKGYPEAAPWRDAAIGYLIDNARLGIALE
jgi:hypothetical protein